MMLSMAFSFFYVTFFHAFKNEKLHLQGGPKKTVPQFYFCNNFRKCTPILTIFSLLEPDIYDA